MAATDPAIPRRLRVGDWLDAGLQLLGTEGVAAVKVEPLCARLGVTKGSFYWHFEDLPSFLTALAQRWSDLREAVRETFETESADMPPAERLKLLMAGLDEPGAQSLERAIREWAVVDARVRERVAVVDRWAYGVIHRAFRDLGFEGADADVRAQTLYFAGIGYLHAARLDRPEAPDHREGLLRLLID